MWWWIEPLFKTGVLCLFLGCASVALGQWLYDNDYDAFSAVFTVLGVLLMLPLIGAAIAVAVNTLYILAHLIWAPYV